MKILINGIKASSKDLEKLRQNLENKKDCIKRVQLSKAKLRLDTV